MTSSNPSALTNSELAEEIERVGAASSKAYDRGDMERMNALDAELDVLMAESDRRYPPQFA